MSASRSFVDTNVFTYTFDDSEPTKQERARALLRDTPEIVVSTQVLQELYVSLTKGRLPITTKAKAEAAVRTLSDYVVVQVDVPLILSAVGICGRDQISFWDALIVSAAAHANCDSLLSEDLNNGQIIEGVRVTNPFD